MTGLDFKPNSTLPGADDAHEVRSASGRQPRYPAFEETEFSPMIGIEALL
jgi:hypothetical protein